MTPAERALVLLTARFLRSVATIDWLSTGLTILCGAAMVFAPTPRWPAILAFALGLVSKVYFLRISLDSRLFEDAAADRLSSSELDSALTTLNLISEDRIGRSWPDRCRGAKRLGLACMAATIAQVLAVIVMALI